MAVDDRTLLQNIEGGRRKNSAAIKIVGMAVVFAVFAVFIAAIWLVYWSAIQSDNQVNNEETKKANDARFAHTQQIIKEASRPAATDYGPYYGLASERVIEMAAAFEKRFAESNQSKPLKESLKQPLITKDEVRHARAALSLIVHTDAKYAAQAQKLLDLIWNDEEEGERAMEAAVATAVADDVDARKAYADQLEQKLLSGGMDAHVSTSGVKGTTLVIRYILVSRPFLYKLMNETAFLDNIKKAGFTTVHFTNGYDLTGTYDIAKNKWN